MKRKALILFSLLAVVCCAAGAKSDRQADAWVDSVMCEMSEREMIGQLFVPRLDITDNEAGLAQLKNMVVKYGIGGILLGKGTCSSYSAIINYGQSVARVPLMITLDGEWGPAMRVTDAPRFPYNMALGAMREPKLAYDFGREVARECRALGIQVDFAPVLDVNSNPRNPVIGQRSFGENPLKVAQLGALFCQGLEDGGVMAVGKHFPGHGDTTVDSHKALPTVNHNRAQLDSVDLLPFREAMRVGMSGIMVGHLKMPALDSKGTPASLSKKITTDLLKTELGFEGLVFTDALAMKGAVAESGENNCVTAFRAGADIMLSSRAPVADMEAMYKALNSGRISQKELKERCKKVLKAKYDLGLNHRPEPADVANVKQLVNSPSAYELIDKLSCAAITAICNPKDVLPVSNRKYKRIAVVSIGEKASNEFSDYCARYAGVKCYGVTETGISASTMKEIRSCDLLIIGVFSSKAWAHGVYRNLVASGSSVGVFFMNPYKMSGFGIDTKKQTVIAAYGDQNSLQRAAAQGVFGRIEISGVLPVNVPGVAPVGTGELVPKISVAPNSLEARIDSIVAECIARKAFPGCQVVVMKKGDFVVNKSYGKLTYDADAPMVNDSTLYDVASLTKPLATVAALMKLYDEGKWVMSDSIGKFVPKLSGSGKGRFSVQSLLNHTTGLGGINLFTLLYNDKWSKDNIEKIRRGELTLNSSLVADKKSRQFVKPVSKGLYASDAFCDSVLTEIKRKDIKKKGCYKYSDLNFVLLRLMAERLSGKSLKQLSDSLYAELGASRTGFMPLNRFSAQNIAPTEYDSIYRKSLICGSVHDELAAFSGGIEGNAGLFSNATDVAKICQMWLNRGEYDGKRYVSPATVKKFTATVSKSGRTPGFDTAARNKDMSDLPSNIYGHTGFTGTAFWIDPDNELIFVFLSNKVYPNRDNKAFKTLNPRVSIMREIYNSLIS